MSCDLCGKTTAEPLNAIRDCYQTDHVKAVCGDCERLLNKHLSTTREKTHGLLCALMRKFIKERQK